MKKTAFFLCWMIITLGVWLLAAQSTSEAPVTILSSVDKSTITIGDLITYTVIIEHDESVNVILPSLGENLGGFEICDYTVYDPSKKEDRILDRVDYIISTFETGEFEIPPMEVRYTIPPDTEEHIIKTESINITVESLKPSEEGDIRDIKPPWDIKFDWRPLLLYGLVGLLVVVLGIGTIIYIRKRRKGETLIPRKREPERPPHEIAYEELKRLEESNLLEKGKIKIFYSAIADIIRRYTEKRFQIEAMELTTSQLLSALENIQEANLIDLYRQLLELCDLVKFAKFSPEASQHIEAVRQARNIVDMTHWRETIASEGPQNDATFNQPQELTTFDKAAPFASEDNEQEITNSGKAGPDKVQNKQKKEDEVRSD
jgi:hypothetical protein